MNPITRTRIVDAIVSDLKVEDYILAIWLEGADGTQSVDEYSDIDLVCYAQEGYVGDAITQLDHCLGALGLLDIAYEEPGRAANNRYKVYHLQDTPDSLLVDATFQSESFPVSFVYEDPAVVPVVLFDKAGVVKFHHGDPHATVRQLQVQLAKAQALYQQRSRAVKYTRRGLFLESLIYYHKYVLRPLVDVLRIVHTPYQPDAFLVHATRDFPAVVVSVLETLFAVQSVEDIAERAELADAWFHKSVVQADKLLAEMSRR